MVSNPWGRSPRFLWALVVMGMVALDQFTKAYFSATIPFGAGMEITSWFNLVHARNTGAAFSFLADAGGWQRYFLILISLLVVLPIAFVCLMKRTDPVQRWIGAAVVAGGSGNLIDRIQTGAVVDFLDLHWRGLHWPAFNLADVWVVAAALAWLVLSVRAPSGPKAAVGETRP
ncbi:signal peptidase II [Rhodoferax saidenbachensis]|uniref:Lipoprotein signal peptidase n=1 Tax=Rhodoferax saidenbachensis TaxID=1484693 RepID=A0A1P8K889_9BURK|nr:signal peptidase II [Rhodoferax saidenbachensis]APW42221.1 signal peptidase II [Rhodoferax saidenbachensis]